MANAPDRPRLRCLDEREDELYYNSLVWTWLPAADEPTAEDFLKTDAETRHWVNRNPDGGEIHSEDGSKNASRSNRSAVPLDDC